MARSMMASTMAWPTMDASHDCRRMVPAVWSRRRMGRSISSADCSKKEMMVLSLVMKSDTCSHTTASFLAVRAECRSMKRVLAMLGPAWYFCSVCSASRPPASVGGVASWLESGSASRCTSFCNVKMRKVCVANLVRLAGGAGQSVSQSVGMRRAWVAWRADERCQEFPTILPWSCSSCS